MSSYHDKYIESMHTDFIKKYKIPTLLAILFSIIAIIFFFYYFVIDQGELISQTYNSQPSDFYLLFSMIFIVLVIFLINIIIFRYDAHGKLSKPMTLVFVIGVFISLASLFVAGILLITNNVQYIYGLLMTFVIFSIIFFIVMGIMFIKYSREERYTTKLEKTSFAIYFGGGLIVLGLVIYKGVTTPSTQ